MLLNPPSLKGGNLLFFVVLMTMVGLTLLCDRVLICAAGMEDQSGLC